MADIAVGYGLFYAKVKAQLTPAIIREGTRRAAKKAIEVIQKRNARGIDRSGAQFAERTPRYLKEKARRLPRTRGTRFKAKAAEDWLAFTGHLNSAMYVSKVSAKKIGGLVEGDFDLDLKGAGIQKQAEGLISGKLGKGKRPGRDFWGLSKPGSAERRKEDREIMREFDDYVAVKMPKGIVLNR